MNKKTLISALSLMTVLGATLILPTTASAHEVVREKRIVVVKPEARHVDRWYVDRHREARADWQPPRYGHKFKKYHKYDKHDHYPKVRHERRVIREYHQVVEQRRVIHETRPVEHRSYDDGLRIHIGYDINL